MHPFVLGTALGVAVTLLALALNRRLTAAPQDERLNRLADALSTSPATP